MAAADIPRTDLSDGAAWMAGRIIPIAEARLPVTDWGLTHSDITYDVAQVWDGAFFRLDAYLDRFMASVHKLRLDIPQTRDEIAAILHDMVAASKLRAAYVSMVASRGTPLVRGSRDPRACANHFFAWAVPFVWVFTPEVIARGAHLLLDASITRIPARSIDPTVKNYHWGDMTRALLPALDAGYDSIVLPDAQGLLSEGPGFNAFIVHDGRVATPKSGVLHGITRRTAIEICAELGLPCDIRDIPVAEALAADEIFLTTSGGGIIPVTRLNGRILGKDTPGPASTAIKDAYWDWHKRPAMVRPIAYGAARADL